MTTTEDRIIAEKDGSFTVNVEGGTVKMNNEPVAWMHPETLECGHGGNVDWEDTGCIPLYTHPIKELTDEEIVSLYESSYLQSGLDEWEFDPVYFARAILKKASEK
jgi:hypothetical protein